MREQAVDIRPEFIELADAEARFKAEPRNLNLAGCWNLGD